MLTEYDMQLLAEVDYDMGKYLIILNAHGDKGINYFACYAEKLKKEQGILASLEADLITWDAADILTKQQLVRDKIEAEDASLEISINIERDIVSGLSNTIRQLIQAASAGNLGSDHISDTDMQTSMIEEIQAHNEQISRYKSAMYGDEYDIKVETNLYDKDLRDDIRLSNASCAQFKNQSEIMDDRRTWVSTAFGIDQKEVEDLIKKYST